MHFIICSIFFSFKNLTKISDKADDVEPNYTDDSTCIQEAENGTCEVQRVGAKQQSLKHSPEMILEK
jgi:hypothetical protein